MNRQLILAAIATILAFSVSDATGQELLDLAIHQQPAALDIATGFEIPSEGYCDQPYVVKLLDGTWLCTMTTGKGHEGQSGQHVVSVRSTDKGKTWGRLVDIEPADGPEASWAMPFLTTYGRVYVFYTYNAKNMREVIASTPYARKRVDTLGEYAFKYSDDGGKTWSKKRWFIPVRKTNIDRRNPYKGKVRFFWGVGKPISHKGSMYLGFTKVERFGENFIAASESWFLRCANIDTQRDPAKLDWTTLPEGDDGLTSPKFSIASEVNLTGLSDGSLFCTYRTIAGHPCHAYSRDAGKTWTESAFMTYGPGGKLVDHPRAANFVRRLDEGPYKGRFIYWFHNNQTEGWDGRNPAFLLGGVEVDGPIGKHIQWGEPHAVLYDRNPKTRISYPDFIWDDGLYITETQKTTARVHRIPDELLDRLWASNALGQNVDDLVGEYRKEPVENDWHIGSIELVKGTGELRWRNKAGRSWKLTPDWKSGVLQTGTDNPYFDDGSREFKLEIRKGKLIGFWFQNSLYLKDGAQVLSQRSQGFHGYISMRTQNPPEGYGYGASFYVSLWPLTDESLAGFQIGLPSTWIIPDNRDFEKPLCPPGTLARDNFHERGPYYRDVFQTIEGGLGYWVSTQFPSTTPKYRMNGTPNGYNHEISSPGWGFGKPKALSAEKMGIAQLSNRLVVPPDGVTFAKGQTGRMLGNAWMVLPLASAKKSDVANTGDNSWTLFLNADNFKGPVAFWIPETWSRLSESYPVIDQRGLDSRPGIMGSGAMEVNTVPYFEATTRDGVSYSKIPKIQFPLDEQGRTFLMQDVKFYAKNSVDSQGRFDERNAWGPALSAIPVRFSQGPKKTNLSGIDNFVQTKIFGKPGRQIFGLQWSNAKDAAALPQYYKQDGKKRVAVSEHDVPASLHLVEQEFRRSASNRSYESPLSGVWTNPGPATSTTAVNLNDGSQVTYAWYRFVDQPSMAGLKWSDKEKNRVQKIVEKMHREWAIDKSYMPEPSSGNLAEIENALVVTPPAGFEIGYVPIVLSQKLQKSKSATR